MTCLALRAGWTVELGNKAGPLGEIGCQHKLWAIELGR